jgi:hypothetical protein
LALYIKHYSNKSKERGKTKDQGGDLRHPQKILRQWEKGRKGKEGLGDRGKRTL